jgi:rhodanese-related sulfurtransferase
MPGTVDSDGVRRMMSERDAQLVEVLPHDEYEEEHIAGAISLPLKQFTAERIATLDRTRPVILYCHDHL